jgi:hypothetical protein
MFHSWKGFIGFLIGLVLTLGLLLTPHLVPGGWGYKAGLAFSVWQIAALLVGGIGVLAGSLWVAGRVIKDATTWKTPAVIITIVGLALIGNTLYMFLIELFGLHSGWRALIAVAGVPFLYGNFGRVFGKTTLRESMINIFTGALTTMGAGFILAVIIRGW